MRCARLSFQLSPQCVRSPTKHLCSPVQNDDNNKLTLMVSLRACYSEALRGMMRQVAMYKKWAREHGQENPMTNGQQTRGAKDTLTWER